MIQTKSSIVSNEQLNDDCWRLRLDSPEIASEIKPGQFIMVRCGEDSLLRRPLSVHQLADETCAAKFAFLYALVGKGTHWLSQRQAGSTLDLVGPVGRGYSIYPGSRNLVLVAGGIGIAPLFFLAQRALNQGYSVTLLLGASTAMQLYPGYLLPPKAKIVIATEDGTAGYKGMITDLLQDYAGKADQVFACGPVPMYRAIAARKLKFLKTNSIQVSLELRMGCGRGVCYGCTIKTKSGLKRVCEDGPVFDLDDVLWDELPECL